MNFVFFSVLLYNFYRMGREIVSLERNHSLHRECPTHPKQLLDPDHRGFMLARCIGHVAAAMAVAVVEASEGRQQRCWGKRPQAKQPQGE